LGNLGYIVEKVDTNVTKFRDTLGIVDFRANEVGADITFEAEAEDEIIAYRRSSYAQVAGMVGVVEITEIAHKRA
jgi:hypothetical protein